MRPTLRAYALSLYLLPRDLRERFGTEMIDLLEERMDRTSSRARRLRILGRGVLDVLVQAVVARTSKHEGSERYAARLMERERRRERPREARPARLDVGDRWSW